MADPIPKTASLAELVPAAGDAGSPRPAVSGPPSGRYALGDEIARGGMGVVHRAVDTALGREVAVKVLHARFGPDSGAARRFADEARITARLQHPNIPAVHDLGTLPDGRPFLAMKLIQGDTLDELLKVSPDPAHDRGRFVAVFEQIGQAVAYAHSCGVIHRDLKPANVMVGAFGEVQVMDWGLAKVADDRRAAGGPGDDLPAKAGTAADTPAAGGATRAGVVVGTPGYLSPEQATGAVDRLDARTDVFGLGSILCVLLTGFPPHCGATPDLNVALAALGRTDECFARLDASGADPELVALCKRCLATRPEDRPADGGAVAREVATLRQAADERARRAELDKVTAEGEVAAAAVAAAERRKRRRVWVGAAAALVVAVVGGLGAVLVVQDQARRDVEAKNRALADEQAKVEAKNAALEAERAKVEQRFEMARKAIDALYTTLNADPALSNEAFRPLRTKQMQLAAQFYRELEGLLAGEADAKARKALAEGLSQLGELTEKIGEKNGALETYRRALAIRRELAAAPGADADTRLDVVSSLLMVGRAMKCTEYAAAALPACEEARDLAQALVRELPTDAARRALGSAYHDVGVMLLESHREDEALASLEKARDLRHTLAEAHPAETDLQISLANCCNAIACAQSNMGRITDSLASYQRAMHILQKLADAHPADTEVQNHLALCHNNIAGVSYTKPEEALASNQKALDIWQKVADAHPADTGVRYNLAACHNNIALRLRELLKPTEALDSWTRGRDILQKLTKDDVTNTDTQTLLALTHYHIAFLQGEMGKAEEALAGLEAARDIRQKLPYATENCFLVAQCHHNIGRWHAYTNTKGSEKALAAYDQSVSLGEQLILQEPKRADYTIELGVSYTDRGAARAQYESPGEAAVDLRRAIKLYAKFPARHKEDSFEHARAYALLAGLGNDPKSGVTAGEATEVADKAIAALETAIKAGWCEPSQINRGFPDFTSVCNRTDFKNLTAGLKANAQPPAREVLPPPRADK